MHSLALITQDATFSINTSCFRFYTVGELFGVTNLTNERRKFLISNKRTSISKIQGLIMVNQSFRNGEKMYDTCCPPGRIQLHALNKRQ